MGRCGPLMSMLFIIPLFSFNINPLYISVVSCGLGFCFYKETQRDVIILINAVWIFLAIFVSVYNVHVFSKCLSNSCHSSFLACNAL